MKRERIAVWMILILATLLSACGDDDDADDDAGDDDDDTADDDTTDDDSDDDDADDDLDDDTEDPVLAGWRVDTVASVAMYTPWYHTSLALDGDSLPAIAYLEKSSNETAAIQLVVSTGGWNVEPLFAGHHPQDAPSIEFDGTGGLIVAFTDLAPTIDDDQEERSLIVAARNGGEWVLETVAASNEYCSFGSSPTLAVDAEGYQHAGFQDCWIDSEQTVMAVAYATNATGDWKTESMNQGSPEEGYHASHLSLAVDGDGAAHLCYGSGGIEGNQTVSYLTNRGDSWTTESVETGLAAQWCTIAVSPNDEPRIALFVHEPDWEEPYDDNPLSLAFATGGTEAWSLEVVDPRVSMSGRVGTVSDSYLVLDGTGAAHIAYPGIDAAGSDVLKYATNATGAWARGIVDPAAGTGSGASIALDADGYVHISYYDEAGYLKYATNRPE